MALACGDDSTPIEDGGLDASALDGDVPTDAQGDAEPIDALERPDAPALCGGRCDDPSCDDSPLCLGTERSPARCQDGRDNDDDGLTDCLDSDCSDNPRVDFCGDETDGPRCSDGIDNDGDGFTDCESPVCIELPECLETTVRIVAANLTSGGTQTYDPGHGLRILEVLRGDILLIQELQYGDNSPAALQTFANQACRRTCRAHRGQSPPQRAHAGVPRGLRRRRSDIWHIRPTGGTRNESSPQPRQPLIRVEVGRRLSAQLQCFP